MTELKYLDITKAGDGHIKVPSIGLISPAITESIAKTALASFSDGAEGIPVSSLIADINHVQNLNGQSAPYPAGGGKNLVAPFRDAEGTSSYGLTMTPNADGSVRVHGTASNSSAVLLSLKSVSIPLPAGTYTFNIGITSSSNKVYGQVVTGAHIFFSRTAKDTFTVASDTTITRLDIGCNAANGEQIDVTIYPQLEAGSTASDYAPYSNVCPITGWTGMNVTRTGKNLLNVTESGVTSSQRCTMTGTEGNLTFTSTGNYGRVGFSISNLTVGNTYTFSCKAQKTATSGNQSVIYLGTSNWTYNIQWLNVSPNGGRDTGDEVSLTYTFTATDSTFFFGVYVTVGNGSGDVIKVKDTMLESGGSATTYESYKSTTYPISWADEAGTVYSGTLDVTNGLLTVTHGIYVFSGSEVWTKQSNAAKYYSSGPSEGYFVRDTAKLPTNNNSSVPILTSIGSFNQSYNELQNHPYTMCIANDGRIGIHETLYGLMEGVQLVYELATPLTYQLTPQAVLTILGQNNIWADTGDVEVAYCADTKMYIDKVIAAL